uniref:Uncharacterized protein n=1 Tax=Arundo donax TaxID=35708 RepID=A0A0A9AFC8_ARUDO
MTFLLRTFSHPCDEVYVPLFSWVQLSCEMRSRLC